ncbi:hypothetical protein Syun_005433 [Stephania yunnanensis]|uniref:Uncharacterized protein n=1 Tax=Stephania yunnanensis TaxID=152371 RepID=A0AAP0Q5Y0_9MAGN
MPPKRNQQRIEEVYDRNNLNRQIGPLIDQHMVAVVLRGDGGIPIADRESSCVGVRRTCADLQVIVSMALIAYLLRSPPGFAPSRAGKRSLQKKRAVLGPPRYGEATRSIMPVAGVQPKGLSERDWRGGHGSEQGHQHDVTVQTPVHEFDDSGSKATPRKRLVKKSGDRERTPDFGIEDEEQAIMRDEFESEPPSSRSGRVEGRWV